jgi:large subunit ribosomal protein L15
MQLHQLKRNTPNKRSQRIGRGGTRGKTSGRGHKGQKARSGHRIRPEARDIIKKIPKRRGYGKHRSDSVAGNREKPISVTLAMLEKRFESGESVTPKTLVEKKVIRARGGSKPSVKVLATGTITKKLVLSGLALSQGARKAIEKAGGTVSS